MVRNKSCSGYYVIFLHDFQRAVSLFAGTIDMTNADQREQDVRFGSTLAWVWWPLIEDVPFGGGMAECIDGRTGLVYDFFREGEGDSRVEVSSMVSTAELVRLFTKVKGADELLTTKTLKQLRAFKRDVSPKYETAKDELLSKHRVFRHWRRREYER